MNSYFNKDDLVSMRKKAEGICISLYMQTPRASIDNKKNAIRLKNKLTEIETCLINFQQDPADIKNFINLAKQTFKDSAAKGILKKSIAIFYSNKQLYSYTLPVFLEEKTEISDTFYTKPLEDFLKISEQKYYVLTLSQKDIKLFQATLFEIEEIPLPNISKSLKEFLGDDKFDSSLQFRTESSQTNGPRTAMFYSSGDKKADAKKNQLLRYFLKVNEVVSSILHQEKEPLILVGVEYLFPIYKKVNSYPNLLANGLKGSPDKFRKEQIHKETLKIIGIENIYI